MRQGKKKLISAMLLVVVAIGAIGFPLLAHTLVTDPRLSRGWQAWWRGAEYLGEDEMIRQQTAYDCGVVCLKMALRRQGVNATLEQLRVAAQQTSAGTSLLGLKRAAEARGVRASAWQLSGQDLARIPLPAIAFIDGQHFVVVAGVDGDGGITVLDPARGRLRYRAESFYRHWQGETLLLGEFTALAPGPHPVANRFTTHHTPEIPPREAGAASRGGIAVSANP